MKIEIKDIGKFNNWTNKVAKQVESKVKDAVIQNVLEGEGQAKLLTPFDTGHLRRSITTELSDDRLSGKVFTNVEYSIFVEEGTSKQYAQPFMYPAFLMMSKNFEADIRKIVRDVK